MDKYRGKPWQENDKRMSREWVRMCLLEYVNLWSMLVVKWRGLVPKFCTRMCVCPFGYFTHCYGTSRQVRHFRTFHFPHKTFQKWTNFQTYYRNLHPEVQITNTCSPEWIRPGSAACWLYQEVFWWPRRVASAQVYMLFSFVDSRLARGSINSWVLLLCKHAVPPNI